MEKSLFLFFRFTLHDRNYSPPGLTHNLHDSPYTLHEMRLFWKACIHPLQTHGIRCTSKFRHLQDYGGSPDNTDHTHGHGLHVPAELFLLHWETSAAQVHQDWAAEKQHSTQCLQQGVR